MKSSIEQKEDVLNVTAKGKSKLQIKENNIFFNHINKLATDNDIIVSNTMIKITYKKALNLQTSSESMVDCQRDSTMADIKIRPTETTTLCNSDILTVIKSPSVPVESKVSVFYSSPTPSVEIEKKKEYVNGLNLPPKPNNSEGKSCVNKVQKKSFSQEGPSSVKKLKTNSSKLTNKVESDNKFLKGDGLVKSKSNIFHRSSADNKKIMFKKVGIRKIKKLDDQVKKKTGKVVKKNKKLEGLKRKLSKTELGIVTKFKKMKVNESNSKIMEGDGREENSRSSSNKKAIMLVDPDLPAGWTRFIRTKNKGSANEQYVVYVVNPQGKKFRFKWKLRKYLQRTNSSLDPDQFFFGLYHRPKVSNSSEIVKKEASTINSGHISLKKFPESSRGSQSEPFFEPEHDIEENEEASRESKSDTTRPADRKELLLYDPDLPFGWKRIIHANTANGRKQVHIISPDGKIFRRRYRLNEYLIKHQYTHNLDRFYFGLYPKKEDSVSENSGKETKEKTTSSEERYKIKDLNSGGSAMICDKTSNSFTNSDNEDDDNGKFKDGSKIDASHLPMYDDPNLPEGWKRFIKIRSCGESAGRMEVVIISPDGRRHRSKKHLEHYLVQKQLNYKVEDFDFTVFGKTTQKKPSSMPAPEPKLAPEPELNGLTILSMKKKFTDKPVPELDVNDLKDALITPEGQMINTVNGLMMCSGLSSIRNERRQRLPKGEHEKQLKSYLSSEGDVSCNGCEIPTRWIQTLVKCRADFRILEPEAASAVAEATKKFIRKLSLRSLASSSQPERGLRYEDVAELVDRIEGLPYLKTLIPKKITFREYIKLNRPKQFMSFT